MGFNTLRPRQNGRHSPDDIFKCIFLNENIWILIAISLKFVPKGPINNIPALIQIMAWSRPGDKPLSEPMMVSLLTHICVTRPQWVNPGHAEFYFRKYNNIFAFSMISQHWDGTGSLNPSLCETRNHLSYLVNTRVADDLVIQGARASATMVLVKLFWNLPVPAPQLVFFVGQRSVQYRWQTRLLLIFSGAAWFCSLPGYLRR